MEQALLESEAMLVHAIVTDQTGKQKVDSENRFSDRYKERVISEISGQAGSPIPLMPAPASRSLLIAVSKS